MRKPRADGIKDEFKSLFAGMDNAKELTDRLKEIAKLEHRSVSMQARVLIIDGINRYMTNGKFKK